MSKLKIFIWLIILSGLLLAIPIAMLFAIDLNDYKTEISAAVEDSTGRKLTINGALSQSILPWLGVTINDVELGNPKELDQQSFLKLKQLKIYVKVFPLLDRRLEIRNIVVDGATLNLQQNKQGINNWTFAQGTEKKVEGKPSLPSSPNQSKTDTGETDKPIPLPKNISLAGVVVKNVNITLRDDLNGASYSINNVQLTLGSIKLDQPVDIKLSADLASTEPKASAHIDLTAISQFNMSANTLQLNIESLKTAMNSDLLPNKKLSTHLSSTINVDIEKEKINIKNLKLTIDKLILTSNLHNEGKFADGKFVGVISIQPFNLREMLATQGIDAINQVPPTRLNKFDLAGQFTLNPETVSLTALNVHLDESTITGTSQVQLATSAITWNILIDKLNIDNYLPPAQQNNADKNEKTATPSDKAPGTTATAKNTQPEALIPVDLVKSLNLNGTTKIGQLTASGAHMKDVVVSVNANKGLARLYPLKANLYGGSVDLDGSVDVTGKQPVIKLKQSTNKLAVGPLLVDAIKFDDLKAITNSKIDITTVGNNMDEWTKNLNGTTEFLLTEGVINKITVHEKLLKAYQKLNNKPLPEEQYNNRTAFDKIMGSLTIKNGIVSSKDFNMTSPELNAIGHGTIDLPKQRIDYLVTATPVKVPKGLGIFKDQAIPFPIKGPFSNISFSADIKGLLAKKAKAKIQHQKDKIDEKKASAKAKLDEIKAKQSESTKKKIEEQKEELKRSVKDRLKKLF